MNLGKLADYVIEYSFYLIVFLVPLIWLPGNYELFEFNKITLTYILATIILGAWLFKALSERKLYIKKTPLDLILLLFLIGNILATVFSMDWHMSLFGYYSRFNGGLTSVVTYIFLYYALVTHFDKQKIIRLLIAGFASSVVVAIYAILQHPNPIFRDADGSFRGIDAGYWVQNAERRAFSTLGQPNWLAAYLSMFFFIGSSFLLFFQKFWQKILILASLLLIFLGFTFAYSRGGTLGFAAGALVFIFFLFIKKPTLWEKIKSRANFIKQSLGLIKPSLTWPKLGKNWLWLAALLLVVLSVNFFFGNAFQERGTSLEVEAPPITQITQLEIEGKQTGQIRLIVWKGAFDIFKNKPIFGSGVETFALSYYQYRPAEHNQTSEWDYLYNKAHNEYLNYLSTTGVAGTLPYLALITLFSFFTIRWLYTETRNERRFLIIGLFAAYVSYLVQNVFGFSVVIIAILFFLIPGIFFTLAEEGKNKFRIILSERYFRFTKSGLWNNATYGLVIILTLALLIITANSWIADTYFEKGVGGETGKDVYSNLQNAVKLRPDEPLFLSELAVAEANLASQVDDIEFAKELKRDSINHIDKAISISPNNLGIWRNKLRVYFELNKSDAKYLPEAIDIAEKVSSLAPTDAKIHYNLSLFYLLEDTKESIAKSNEVLLKVLGWRPEYNQARRQLAANYIEQGKNSKAIEQLEYNLELDPEDYESLNLLESLQ
jgi:O-antigen ligase